MKFNSQICTTKEQSERLLALGLKKGTADMCLHSIVDLSFTQPFSRLEKLVSYPIIPAWSLHRLIELCAIPKVPFITVMFQNTYDEIISLIEEAIKLDAFDKEYLEEK